jgi:hypothetical protein
VVEALRALGAADVEDDGGARVELEPRARSRPRRQSGAVEGRGVLDHPRRHAVEAPGLGGDARGDGDDGGASEAGPLLEEGAVRARDPAAPSRERRDRAAESGIGAVVDGDHRHAERARARRRQREARRAVGDHDVGLPLRDPLLDPRADRPRVARLVGEQPAARRARARDHLAVGEDAAKQAAEGLDAAGRARRIVARQDQHAWSGLDRARDARRVPRNGARPEARRPLRRRAAHGPALPRRWRTLEGTRKPR